jgi:hypothetical protein
MMPHKKEKKYHEDTSEAQSRIAQEIVDRKVGLDWINQKARYTISGKYSFAVHTHTDYVFVDGINNRVDVLKKDDLSLVGSFDTEGNAVFCFIVHGLKVFVGCAGNNLFIFDMDSFQKMHSIKTANIVYCFLQLDYNTILCGERDGYV